jgi:hypothetical protein
LGLLGEAMHRVGKFAMWLGLALTLIGLLVGFPLLFMDRDDLAMLFLGMVPFGFLFLFSGLVGVLLGGNTR